MAPAVKRITFILTKEDMRELDVLSDFFGENKSQIIKRALILLHRATILERKHDKNN